VTSFTDGQRGKIAIFDNNDFVKAKYETKISQEFEEKNRK
jgi:hypothetical protein